MPDDLDVVFEYNENNLPKFISYIQEKYTCRRILNHIDITRFDEDCQLPVNASGLLFDNTTLRLNQIICNCTMSRYFDYFDFDFCKIAFNGKNLMIHDFNSIVNRKCVFDLTKYNGCERNKCKRQRQGIQIDELYAK